MTDLSRLRFTAKVSENDMNAITLVPNMPIADKMEREVMEVVFRRLQFVAIDARVMREAEHIAHALVTDWYHDWKYISVHDVWYERLE